MLRNWGHTGGNLGVVSLVRKSYFHSPRRVRREIGGGYDRLRIQQARTWRFRILSAPNDSDTSLLKHWLQRCLYPPSMEPQ